MNKILIVGGNSLVGVEIIKKEVNAEIFVVVNKRVDRIPSYCKIISLDKLGDHYFEKVYLIASNIPYGNFNSVTDELIKSNIELPFELIRNINCKRIVYASSVSVYGNLKSVNINSETCPNNAYGVSKLIGETIVMRHPSFGIARFPSLFGEEMDFGGFAGRLVEQAKDGRIIIFGDGKRSQNYLHYKDAAEILFQLSLTDENKVVLGIAPTSFSNIELANLAKSIIRDIIIEHKGEDNTQSIDYRYEESLSLIKNSNFTTVIDYLKRNL